MLATSKLRKRFSDVVLASDREGRRDMKILQVNDNYEGGGASVVMRQLAKILTRRGHEVYFAARAHINPTANNVYKIHHLNRVLFHLVRRLVFFNVDPIAYYDFEKIVKKIKPDIVHCHNLATRLSLEIVKVSIKYKIPCVVTIHDYWPVCLNRTLMKGSWRKPRFEICDEVSWDNCPRECTWEALKRTPNIKWGMTNRRKLLLNENVTLVAVSNYVKTVLERFGYPSEKIKVIYDGVDVNVFKPLPQFDEKMVLFAGGSGRLKGYEHFMAMAKRIKRHEHDARFIMLGQKVTAVPDFIENPGRIPDSDLVDYYQRTACVCMPSLWPEAFGLVAIESMACAKPVVAYASGGLTEIVENGKTGFLVERRNMDEFTEKVQWLLDNEDAAKERGLKARKRAEKLFSLERMCDEYEEIYTQIMDSYRR